ncbi:UNVERIFIED_CONTAM: hypothetical protein RMT77_006595 [Armadillidium vulgare]
MKYIFDKVCYIQYYFILKNIIITKERYHSTKGELTVSDPRWRTPLSDIFIRAGQELGYFTGDYNAENQTGFSSTQFTIRDGFRCSTNRAFLLPVGKRKNIDIARNSHVTKVLIDPDTKRAYGVRFFRYGEYHDVLARKEVILSAGVFNTPKLLMLSGIGPEDHLHNSNVPLIKDLPVGFNLQDHIAVFMMFLTDKPVTYTLERYTNLLTNMTYELYQKGPFSSPGFESTAFLNSRFQDPEDSHPDIQLLLVPATIATGAGRRVNQSQSRDELSDSEETSLPIANEESFAIHVALLRPQSRGRLLLRSNDPFAKPVLRMNYFNEENDVERLADGARFALNLMKTEAFKSINARYDFKPISLCPNALPSSDEYFECLIRYNTQAGIHATGTAKMGPSSDSSAVIDPELRVRGISNLRVIDASVMPNIVSGNTNAPTIMIGEKGSDLIKDTWSNKRKMRNTIILDQNF